MDDRRRRAGRPSDGGFLRPIADIGDAAREGPGAPGGALPDHSPPEGLLLPTDKASGGISIDWKWRGHGLNLLGSGLFPDRTSVAISGMHEDRERAIVRHPQASQADLLSERCEGRQPCP